MITLENVSYRYANTEEDAVRNLSFTVQPGELKLVTGASGCGKTTLMRLVNGLSPQIYQGQVTGEIRCAGANPSVTPLAQLSDTIGTLFQDPEEQFFALNVKDEIAFAPKSRGWAEEDIARVMGEVAERLGIAHILDADIHTLSEGQKQKVALASLLVMRPKILVLDEPSANLDPEATLELAKILSELKSEGTAILVVDHRLYWLKDWVDEVLVMSAGEIVARGDWTALETSDWEARYGLRRPDVEDPRTTLPRVAVSHAQSSAEEKLSHRAPANTLFGVQELQFAYKGQTPIFDGCAFYVEPGITALIGPNGTGKTTLARVPTGLNVAQQGRFMFRDQVVSAKALLERVGLVLQNADHQLQMRTVAEEISMSVAVGRMLRAQKRAIPKLTEEDAREAQEWIEALNLVGLGGRHPQSLSGGQKQRVVIACALAKQPDILILDEPTSGLDGANMQAIATVLKREADKGRAIFLITHDLELLRLCDYALDMRDMVLPVSSLVTETENAQ